MNHSLISGLRIADNHFAGVMDECIALITSFPGHTDMKAEGIIIENKLLEYGITGIHLDTINMLHDGISEDCILQDVLIRNNTFIPEKDLTIYENTVAVTMFVGRCETGLEEILEFPLKVSIAPGI